jgi:hypothetical protein
VLLHKAKETKLTTRTSGNTEGSRPNPTNSGGKPRETKKTRLIRLLSAKAGADVAAISGKLGWQPHTTRAAITGLKKAGYEVTTEKPDPDKPTRYRIVAGPRAAAVVPSTPEPANAG